MTEPMSKSRMRRLALQQPDAKTVLEEARKLWLKHAPVEGSGYGWTDDDAFALIGTFERLMNALAASRAQVEALTEERDLAVAHDTQPYPTAEAYERVCAARDKGQARAEALEAIEAHDFVVGPEYRPGPKGPRIGWAVYEDWSAAAGDTFSEDGSASVLAVGLTIAEAVAKAALARRVSHPGRGRGGEA